MVLKETDSLIQPLQWVFTSVRYQFQIFMETIPVEPLLSKLVILKPQN